MYEFENYSRFKKEDLPSFARLTFSLKSISDKSKKEIVDKVLEPYMTNQEFRNSIQDYYLYFLDDEYIGIFKNNKDAKIPSDYPGYKIMVILISDNPPISYFLNIYQETSKVDKGVNIRVEKRTYVDDTYISERSLVDTGASYSTIPGMEYWDFRKKQYKFQSANESRYSFNYSILNLNIEKVEPLEIQTAVGNTKYFMVTWKEDLNTSIGELPPIKIKKMIVPIEYSGNLNIIGMDVLTKHTLILSSVDGNVDLKIFSSEVNDLSQKNFIKVAKKATNFISNVSESFMKPFKMMDSGIYNFYFDFLTEAGYIRFTNYVNSHNISPDHLEDILNYVRNYNQDLKRSLRIAIIIDNNIVNESDFDDEE